MLLPNLFQYDLVNLLHWQFSIKFMKVDYRYTSVQLTSVVGGFDTLYRQIQINFFVAISEGRAI